MITADLVLYNGEIVSMDNHGTITEAIAVKDGKIVQVGSYSDMKHTIHDKTTVIDLDGKTVLPGFIDAHQHIFQTGYNLMNVNCGKSSINEIVTAIEEAAKEKENENEWIIGWGLNEANIAEKRLPDASDLSHIPNPVYITRFCLHTAVVNDKALSIAGINNGTPDPDGGEIIRNADGSVKGILRETAMDLMKEHLPPYSTHSLKEAVKCASDHYRKNGITHVHEAGLGFLTGTMNELRALIEMSLDGTLGVRMNGMILESYFKEAKQLGLLTGFGNSLFKIGAIKMFADGTLSGQTAAVNQPYTNSVDNTGILIYSPEELSEKIIGAHKAGFQVAVHGIGDRAIEHILSAYERALKLYPREDHRHRIEHCGIIHEEIVDRLKESDIIAVPHPGIVHFAGDTYKRVLNEQVVKGLYAVKTLLDAGILVAGSSDSPVIPCSPLIGMYTAMSRESIQGDKIVPQEGIPLYDAVKMYTINAAKAAFTDHEVGSIEIGKFADLTILPGGFMNYSAVEVKETEVEMTIIDGEIVYQKELEIHSV
ncbi:amidohydrolase [Siminovitchia sediminis]|uniref:Amidohydrolase n=1 Tax=Siminovitchia sediminis TaxID=1274353 RepID=A0ABW4KGT4_9BACI